MDSVFQISAVWLWPSVILFFDEFDVVAADFGEDVGVADYLRALDGVESGAPLSLYVHIPYCEQICWYCGCNTGAANRVERLSGYLEALRQEVALVLRRLEDECC